VVANHAVTDYIEILVIISLQGWLFFLLLHPASEEEKQKKTNRNSDVDVCEAEREEEELFERCVKRGSG